MSYKDLEDKEKRLEANRAYFKRLETEEKGEFNRSTTDPEFTTEDIAQFTGWSIRDVTKIIRLNKIGRMCKRRNKRGDMRKMWVVKYKELMKIRYQFGF